MAKTQLSEYVSNDIEKQKGVYMPVRAGLIERMLVRKALCSKLHPNAEDEFSIDSVGPSYRIIGEYEKKFREAMQFERKIFDEPLLVEKLRIIFCLTATTDGLPQCAARSKKCR